MKINKTHNDLEGITNADISDITFNTNSLKAIAEHYNLDQNKLKVVGISIIGTKFFNISFICIDKEKSTPEKEHIIKVITNDKIENLSILFKEFQTILFSKSDKKYYKTDINEEKDLSEYTNVE